MNISREEYLRAVNTVKEYHHQCLIDMHDNTRLEKPIKEPIETILKKRLEELDFDISTRLYNNLRAKKIDTVQDCLTLSIRDILRTRNMGKKCVSEMEALFKYLGIEWPVKN